MRDSEPATSVTIVSQVFHPDTSANAGLLTELATGLTEREVDVTVLTTYPSYTKEDRESTALNREHHEGVYVRRLPSLRFDRNRGVPFRMANELSFFLVALCYMLARRIDGPRTLVLPTAPTFLPVLGWLLQPLGYRSIPVVMDLYPDMAVQLGFLSEDSVVYRVWDWLNRRTYPRADCIVTIGETMATTIREQYGADCTLSVIHNWEDGDFIEPQPKAENPFAQEHGLLNELTVLYSGNLGRHHDLESIVEAAGSLDHETLSLEPHFLFIGEGGKKADLRRRVDRQGLSNVDFLPYQPVEVLPDSLTAGDVAIVTMADGVEGLCVSSKFYTALASGSAVLAISRADAEIGAVVEQTGCGIRVDPNSPEAIADALHYWATHPDTVEEMGQRARDIFEAEFTKQTAVSKYKQVIQSVDSDVPQ